MAPEEMPENEWFTCPLLEEVGSIVIKKWRDRHAKIDALTTFDRAVHRSEIGQVALHDLCPKPA